MDAVSRFTVASRLRHRAALQWHLHLKENPIEPLQRSVQVQLDPARR